MIETPDIDLEIDEGIDLPDIIPNSTLQLDGDISCYYSAWTDMPLGACINQLKRHIETKRLLAGCEVVNVHTTHGSKAGREDIAMVNEYQKQRKENKDEAKSERVAELRTFLETYKSETVNPVPSYEVEADDAMNIMQRVENDLGNYSAICTKDKDLLMCPGNHFTYDDMEAFVVPDGFGKLYCDETTVPSPTTKSGFRVKKKVYGRGTSQLWLQLLMGDTADTIPGLPRVSGQTLNKYQPTKGIEKAYKLLSTGTAIQKRNAQKTINARKSSTVGQITAYNILNTVKSDKAALKLVYRLYKDFYGHGTFNVETWRGDILKLNAGDMVLEQARLLWMLRTWDDDVYNFFKEITCDTPLK